MKRLFSALAAGAKAATGPSDHGQYEVAGIAVRCPHCGGDRFVEGRAQLNTAGMTMMGLDWANRSAATLVCTGCGRIEWFLADPEERV